jgi:hypothetical protein
MGYIGLLMVMIAPHYLLFVNTAKLSNATINRSRWDAATGLGTPNFLELRDFVLNYPKKW